MNSLLESFKQDYQAKGRAKTSVKEVMRRLNAFIDYLDACGITRVDQISRELVRAYQTESYQRLNRFGRPNSISYQNELLCAVKLFTRFLKTNNYIVADPAEAIPYAKKPKRLPRSILTKTEVRKIMQVPDTNTLIGYRNRTMLEVLYSTGIRRAELLGLTLADVDFHDGFLRITGKGDKDRIVPLGRIACRYLENYIKSVRPEFIRDPYNSYVFLSLIGARLSNTVVLKFIKRYAQKAGIKKPVCCHTFRHTCATLMLNNKANIKVIQELLGHASLDTTQIYTRVSITDLKAVHRQCHPREKDKE